MRNPTCDRCGIKTNEAYQITRWFNGIRHVETLCKDCIKKIGKTSEIEEISAEEDAEEGEVSGA